MENFKVFRFILKPIGYFSTELSSFTIFGALCWAVRYLYGEEKVLELIRLVKDKKFLLSSAMPWIDGKDYIFKPILKPEHIKKEDIGIEDEGKFRNFIKKFRKLSFVPFDTLIKVTEGEIKSDRDLMISLKKEIDKEISLFSFLSLPHAKLNRITNSTSEGGEFYFEESLFFKFKIYFLAAVKDENHIDGIIAPSLKLLQDWGIGGNRSIGFGSFSFEVKRTEEFEKFINQKGRKFITLSPVVATDRIDYRESFYDIKTYKGAIESGYKEFLWKPRIFYLKGGSLIKLKEGREVAGALLKPFENIELYHYGLEFPVYIKESQDES
jgi:CRISPR-associated protein Csm4